MIFTQRVKDKEGQNDNYTSLMKQPRIIIHVTGDYFLFPFLGRGDGLGLFSERAQGRERGSEREHKGERGEVRESTREREGK